MVGMSDDLCFVVKFSVHKRRHFRGEGDDLSCSSNFVSMMGNAILESTVANILRDIRDEFSPSSTRPRLLPRLVSLQIASVMHLQLPSVQAPTLLDLVIKIK